jgi:hypothetical protein
MLVCVSIIGTSTVPKEIPSTLGYTSNPRVRNVRRSVMYKVKFRVFSERLCRKCKKVHPQPTHRAIYHQSDGDEYTVIQEGHALAVTLLEGENKLARKNKKRENLRPYYQYSFEVGK